MPWCHDCDRFWNPGSMTAEGACPTCGRKLEVPSGPTQGAGGGAAKVDVKALAGADAKAPWHFKLLVGALVGYLAWRLVEVLIWVVEKL